MHGAVLQLFKYKTSVGTIPGINRYWSSLVFMNVLLPAPPPRPLELVGCHQSLPERAGDGGGEKFYHFRGWVSTPSHLCHSASEAQKPPLETVMSPAPN